MPYVANKNMNLAGKMYAKGDLVPDEVFADIPAHRQGALTRTRLIIEVEVAPQPAGDMCPHCNQGPFQRLAQHVSLKHEDVLPSDEGEADILLSEETDSPEENDGNS